MSEPGKDGQRSILKPQDGDRCVDVVEPRESAIIGQHPCCHMHLFNFLASRPPDDVEIMDHEIAEEPAAGLQDLFMWWFRVVRSKTSGVKSPELAGRHEAPRLGVFAVDGLIVVGYYLL